MLQRHTDRANIAEVLDALVASDGTGSHGYILSGKLLADRDAKRNLSDAVHYLCLLHGRYPGVIDGALERSTDSIESNWLSTAANGFARERTYLSRLASAVGPIPSTLGHDACESAVAGQRRALEMLSQSERSGCALGAAMALCLDWFTIRAILDSAAERNDIQVSPCSLPDVRLTADVVLAVAQSEAKERALNFGAQQLLSQHRGLWDLLSAREESRRED